MLEWFVKLCDRTKESTFGFEKKKQLQKMSGECHIKTPVKTHISTEKEDTVKRCSVVSDC